MPAKKRLSCPKCDVDMNVRAVRGIVIDHCPKCSGLWFDKGELNHIVKSGGEDALRALSIAYIDPKTGELELPKERDWKQLWYDEKPGACPRCLEGLERKPSKIKKELNYDECPDCGGTWYDGGEIFELLTAMAAQDGLIGLIKRLFVRR